MAWWKRRNDRHAATPQSSGDDPTGPDGSTDPRIDGVAALTQRALELQALGRLDLALDLQEESVSLARELAADHTEPVHTERLADCLYGLAAALIATGRVESALPVLDESQATYRRLADDGVLDAVPLVADVRARRANALLLLGRTATATVEIAFAAETYRNLANGNGNGNTEAEQRHAIDLARMLCMNAVIVAADGDPTAACASADLAIRLFAANTAAVNATEQPIAYVVALIDACRVASAVHAVQGRLELALAADEIAVGNAESLVRVAGIDHAPRLVEAASRRAAHLIADGRGDQAAASMRLARDHDPAAEPATAGESPRLRHTLAMALMRAGELGIDVPSEVRALAPSEFPSAEGELPPWAASRRCGTEVMLNRAAALGEVGRRLLPLSPPDGILVCLEAHTMYAFAVQAAPVVGSAELRRYAPGWHALLEELIPPVRQDGREALADDLGVWAGSAGEMASRDDSVPVMLDPGWGPTGRPDPRRLAGIALVQMRLGERSARIGELDDALFAGEASVWTFRSLVAETDEHLGSLAEALHLQAAHLYAAGRTDEAIQAGAEALGYHRRWVEEDPSARLALARTLHQLAGMLAHAGRDADALVGAAEAVQTHRQIADSDPGNAMPRELAEALSTLGGLLARDGRHDEAAAAESEATELRGAEGPPDDIQDPGDGVDHDGDHARLAVAGTLIDLARRFSAVGRAGEARLAALEALDLHAELSGLDPERAAEAAELAHDSTPAERAVDLNRMGIAAAGSANKLLAGEASVRSFRDLAAAAPDEHRTGLAMALNNLGGHLAAAGDHAGAIGAAEESVSILRALDGPALASAVANLGRHLRAAGRDGEAQVALSEAVGLFERLAAESADHYSGDLDAVRRLERLSRR